MKNRHSTPHNRAGARSRLESSNLPRNWTTAPLQNSFQNSRIPSAYESQAARWKKGFQRTPNEGKSSQNIGIEAPLVSELCSSIGSSSFPPRDTLQKLLRHLNTIDHEYLCELLDEKLQNVIWQVQAKALSVIDALIKSKEGDFYERYYARNIHLVIILKQARKDMLRVRAEKVHNALRHILEKMATEENVETIDQTEAKNEVQRGDCVSEPYEAESTGDVQGDHFVSKVGWLPDASMDKPSSRLVISDEGSSQKCIDISTQSAPSATESHGSELDEEPLSPCAFSFLTEKSPDIFNARAVPKISKPVCPKEEPIDPFAAFDEIAPSEHITATGTVQNDEDENSILDDQISSFDEIELDDVSHEVILEAEVPPGPIGLVLDDTISEMGVIARFNRLPSGAKGMLELHPAICPGCKLVYVNSIHVEHKSLDEIGQILAQLATSTKVFRFKKYIVHGRTANPATMAVPYVPPPVRQTDFDFNEMDEDQMSGHLTRLESYRDELDSLHSTVDNLISVKPSSKNVRNQLTQIHGSVEKILTEKVDSIIFGPKVSTKLDTIRAVRSNLVKKADNLMQRVQSKIAEIDQEGTLAPMIQTQSDTFHLNDVGRTSILNSPRESLESGVNQSQSPCGDSASAFSFLKSEPPNCSMNANDLHTSMQSTSPTAFSFLCSRQDDTTDQSSSAFSFITS